MHSSIRLRGQLREPLQRSTARADAGAGSWWDPPRAVPQLTPVADEPAGVRAMRPRKVRRKPQGAAMSRRRRRRPQVQAMSLQGKSGGWERA
ncbi:hypothetical protein [Kribbella sp. NPDC055071]